MQNIIRWYITLSRDIWFRCIMFHMAILHRIAIWFIVYRIVCEFRHNIVIWYILCLWDYRVGWCVGELFGRVSFIWFRWIPDPQGVRWWGLFKLTPVKARGTKNPRWEIECNHPDHHCEGPYDNKRIILYAEMYLYVCAEGRSWYIFVNAPQVSTICWK